MPSQAVVTENMMSLVRTPLNETLLGVSAAIQETLQLVQRLGKANLTVLVTGESGTGKDIAARMLHKLSPRYGKPFIKVNCPAIPESILESELFGYERGAFTGARTSKPGRFELANKGTIFLDEIAETSYNVQSKLLQVLEGEPFMRIGGVTPVLTDVRIIAATNVSLEESVRSGRFREDIFFRLSEVVLRMPPLRERPEDIPLLAEHFNYNYLTRMGRPYTPLPADVLTRIREMSWPGNVRELGARIKEYAATGDPAALNSDSASSAAALQSAPIPLPVNLERETVREPEAPSRGRSEERKLPSLKEATRRAVEETERQLIEDALRLTLWNRRKAAQMLDISYSSLLRRIDAYNIGKSNTP